MSANINVNRPAPYLQKNWDWRAAGNFIGGGTGSGLIIASACFYFLGLSFWLTGLIGLVCIGFGLLCVWAEIGKPWRALHVFFHPGTSWMTREAIVAMPLGLVTLLAAVASFGLFWQGAEAVFILVASLIAIVYLYCQARILKEAKGIPAWRQPALMPVMMTSGFAEGMSVLAIVELFVGSPDIWFIAFLAVMTILRLAAWYYYLHRLAEDKAPKKAIDSLQKYAQLLATLGHGLPVLLCLVALTVEVSAAYGTAIAGVLVIAAGWAIKYIVVCRASFNQGFAIPQMPIRGKGNVKGAAKPGW